MSLPLRPHPEPTKPMSATGWLTFVCPLPGCGDTTGHLGVNPSSGGYSCWKCGAHGTIRQLRQITGVEWPIDETARLYRPDDLTTADDVIALAYGLTAPRRRSLAPEAFDYIESNTGCSHILSKESMIAAGLTDRDGNPLPLVLPDFGENALTSMAGSAAYYLNSRGIADYVAQAWNILVVDTDGKGKHSPYEGRVLVMAIDPLRAVVRNFAARAMFKQEPRYLTPKIRSTCTGMFPSPRMLGRYGAPVEALLVEGPFDVLSADAATMGTPTIPIALGGKQLTPLMLAELRAWGVVEACVMLDADAKNEAILVATQLNSFGIKSTLAGDLGVKDPGAAAHFDIIRAIDERRPLATEDLYLLGSRK